jgi:hypothetical protein
MLCHELPGSLRGAGGRQPDPEHPLSEAEIDYSQDQLAGNYRQLVLNYERMRDFDTAEDFHVGRWRCEASSQRAGFNMHCSGGCGAILARISSIVYSAVTSELGSALCWLLVWLLFFPLRFYGRRLPAGGPYRWQTRARNPLFADASSGQCSSVALGLWRSNFLQPFDGNFPASSALRVFWPMVLFLDDCWFSHLRVPRRPPVARPP